LDFVWKKFSRSFFIRGKKVKRSAAREREFDGIK